MSGIFATLFDSSLAEPASSEYAIWCYTLEAGSARLIRPGASQSLRFYNLAALCQTTSISNSRVLTSNPLGFLTDIVAEAYDLACVVDVRHWWSCSRRLPFLGRPTGRFAVVSMCLCSLGKNNEARWLMASKTSAIAMTRLRNLHV